MDESANGQYNSYYHMCVKYHTYKIWILWHIVREWWLRWRNNYMCWFSTLL